MNKIFALLALFAISATSYAQTPFKGADYIYWYQVGVGKTNGSSTAPSAWLEIGKDSTNKGLRLPRVVDTANISSPVYGLYIYQIKDNSIYFRDKFGWRRSIDANIISQYLPKSDSTIYYPFASNPKGYISTEVDPNANSKTIRWIPGTGINVSNSSAQPLSGNPSATISAQNTTALWNANQLLGTQISSTVPVNGQVLQYNGSEYVPVTLPSSGTVNSVGLSLPGAVFNISGSPVTTSGALTGSFKAQFANQIFSSPDGISGTPTFRSLTNSDLPSTGVLPGTYGADSATAKVTVNSKGLITNIANVNSAVSWDSVRRKPFTTFPTWRQVMSQGNSTIDNAIFTGLSTDPADIVFRTSTAEVGRIYADVTGLQFSAGNTAIPAKFTILNNGFTGIGTVSPVEMLEVNGNIVAQAPAYSTGGISPIGRNTTTGRLETYNPVGGGTVNSVGLTMPTEFSVSNSPITSSGSLTVTKVVQSANTIYSGPVSGAAAAPSFRSLVSADIPSIDAGKISTGTIPISRGGTGLSSIGLANQQLRVNSAANALEYFSPKYPVVLKSFFNDETGSSNVMSYTVPNTYMANNGDFLEVAYAGTFAATSTTHIVGISINGDNGAGSMSNGTISGGTWRIKSTIVRVSNTTVRVSTFISFNNSGSAIDAQPMLTVSSEITGLNISTSGIPISINIGVPTTNVTATLGTITFYPAP